MREGSVLATALGGLAYHPDLPFFILRAVLWLGSRTRTLEVVGNKKGSVFQGTRKQMVGPQRPGHPDLLLRGLLPNSATGRVARFN